MSNVISNRFELLKLKQKKVSFFKGYKLLKDKRDSLIQKFIAIINETIKIRKELDNEYLIIIEQFKISYYLLNKQYVSLLIDSSDTKINLTVNHQSIMSVNIPKISFDFSGVIINYSILETSIFLDSALLSIKKLIPKILFLIEKESALFQLAKEIEKTRRRVNALEYVLIPQLDKNIKHIKNKLSEKEIESIVGLIKLKEKII